jgi:uncharacterized membrane protein YccF (DUF307 family)
MTALDLVDQSIEVETKRDNPNLLLRILWFLLVGWWLGFWAIVVGYFCLILIIPAPIGIALLDRLPRIMTLRAPARTLSVHENGESFEIEPGKVDQRSWLIRIPWLLLVGWWMGLIWLVGAYLITLFTFGIGLPFSFWMFARAAKVITLYRG